MCCLQFLGLELLAVIPIYYPPLDRAKTKHRILTADVEDGDFERLMVEANEAFPYEFREEWARLLRGLAEPDMLPAVIHCTDGKDRTGFAVALVLRALGVPEETVFEDYFLGYPLGNGNPGTPPVGDHLSVRQATPSVPQICGSQCTPLPS